MANAVIRRRDECNDRATGADLSPKGTFAVNLFYIAFYAFSFGNAGELRRFPRAAHGRAPAEARDRAYPGDLNNNSQPSSVRKDFHHKSRSCRSGLADRQERGPDPRTS